MPIGSPGRKLPRLPPKGLDIIKITFRVERATDIRIRRYCLANHISRSDYLRKLVESALDEHDQAGAA